MLFFTITAWVMLSPDLKTLQAKVNTNNCGGLAEDKVMTA